MDTAGLMRVRLKDLEAVGDFYDTFIMRPEEVGVDPNGFGFTRITSGAEHRDTLRSRLQSLFNLPGRRRRHGKQPLYLHVTSHRDASILHL
jgi:hypothetical protein